MPKADDPYYNRKPVPAELIQDVGYTGLTPQEEFYTREKKYLTSDGSDLRKFSASAKGGLEPINDPYYGRKPVNVAETHGVGDTGLSAEEEYLSRERKYSVQGEDIRKFSSAKGGLSPNDDPYYGRKQVNKAETVGVGETDITPAQAYAERERKQSVVNFDNDPFNQIAGTGHRKSIVSDYSAGASQAATRRRSSAVAPNAAQAAAHHSGYEGERLAPIESKPELPPVNLEHSNLNGPTTTTTTTTTTNTAVHHGGGLGFVHDATTLGPTDNIEYDNTPRDNIQSNNVQHSNIQHNNIQRANVQQEYDDPDSVAPDVRV